MFLFCAPVSRLLISFPPPVNKKCRVFSVYFFLKGVAFLFLFLFVPSRCALEITDLRRRVEPAALQYRRHPAVILLVLVKRRAREMTYDLTVRRGRAFHPAIAPVTGRADARIAAGRARPTVH